MDSKKYREYVLSTPESKMEYGICPPPISAQDGLNVLTNHILGDNWYVAMPVSTEQTNTEAVYSIMKKYDNMVELNKFKNIIMIILAILTCSILLYAHIFGL